MTLIAKFKKTFPGFALDVDFEAENDVTALLGASGCGKSMTLKCVAGIVTPDEGIIVSDGVTLFDSKRNVNLSPQRRRVGLLFQNYALFPNMTVEKNILAGLAREKNDKAKRECLRSILRAFRLEGLEQHFPHQISGGQQQRVALARILAGEPKLLMLDEPFSALDSYLKWKLEQELTDTLSAFPGTTLYVSHNRDEVFRLSQHVLVMDHGKTQPLMPVRTLFHEPGTLSAALLSGCKNFSRARRAGETKVYALDWGATLECGRAVDGDVRFIGVRAHHIALAEQAGASALPCTLARTVENLFSTAYVLLPKGAAEGSDYAQIQVETSAPLAGKPGAGEPVTIFLRPADILLLK